MLQQLTHNQQEWLDHINQTLAQNLSMSAYAKQNNLSLKAFYYARTVLVQKGVISPSKSNQLISVTTVEPTPSKMMHSCRVTLNNGIVIDFAEVDITRVLNEASQL